MNRFACALFAALVGSPLVAGAGWEFVQNGTSGILALEAIIASLALAPFFDFAGTGGPLMINGRSAWALEVVSDTFCVSGGLTPSLYDLSAPLGHRISNKGLPTTDIARMYHSTVTLTPSGNILLAGSNPNMNVNETVKFPTSMSLSRPTLSGVPTKVAFNSKFTVRVTIPAHVAAFPVVKVALMDLGFSSHAFHSSSRLVWLEATLSSDRETLQITSPPNNGVYPPGLGYIFVTVGDTTSVGTHVMVGSGASPPVPDQGRRI
ncbi:immunoglobulin E-set [Mycena capillaripes]|nr:immunoglobulin E-set [Mycena capillaripes]